MPRAARNVRRLRRSSSRGVAACWCGRAAIRGLLTCEAHTLALEARVTAAWGPPGRRSGAPHPNPLPAGWNRLSRRYLLDHPVCACGCGRPATVTDHILPRATFPEIDPRDARNWQALARGCHSRKTGDEATGVFNDFPRRRTLVLISRADPAERRRLREAFFAGL